MLVMKRTYEFAKWLNRLKDRNAKAKILVRLQRVSRTGVFGDCKSIGGGLYELRIDYGPGYRIYFAKNANSIVLLLLGGDKSTQQRDIERAQRIYSKIEFE